MIERLESVLVAIQGANVLVDVDRCDFCGWFLTLKR